jgi:hypothetical protein
MEHWLLYTCDREFGGHLTLGIFNSSQEAWDYYIETHDDNDRYYRIPFVEQWVNNKKITEE